jgi:nucleotide-binding universal stress UspA family protein
MKALPDVEGYTVYGLTGEELAVFGNAVDILIVGSRDYGPMRHQVIGSTCAYLQRHARCPLLVLPRSATAPGEDSTASGELQAKTAAGTAI